MPKVTLTFRLEFDAGPDIVWEALWKEDNYRFWTSAFCEGSHAVSDWKQGSTVHFLDGKGGGMHSIITQMDESRLMEFTHQGEILNSIAQAPAEWAGFKEAYSIEPGINGVALNISTDVTEEYREMMERMWPDALEKIRVLVNEIYRARITDQMSGKAVAAKDPVCITVSAIVNAQANKVWDAWTLPEHITMWNHASDDWHCPRASNDLRPGGKLSATMAAKDGSFSFDFDAVYDRVQWPTLLHYIMTDGREVLVTFEAVGADTRVIETFDAESINSLEMQRGGWQAILNNFKKYTEGL